MRVIAKANQYYSVDKLVSEFMQTYTANAKQITAGLLPDFLI